MLSRRLCSLHGIAVWADDNIPRQPEARPMVVLALRRSGCCTALAKAEWWRPGGLARDRYALRKSHEMRGRSWSWALGRAPPRNDAACSARSSGSLEGLTERTRRSPGACAPGPAAGSARRSSKNAGPGASTLRGVSPDSSAGILALERPRHVLLQGARALSSCGRQSTATTRSVESRAATDLFWHLQPD